jgi:hypothetical protein
LYKLEFTRNKSLLLREEVEERVQPETMFNKSTDEEKDLQKQNQELKQEVKEYQLLDRHIKKENEQLKATSQQLQD